MSLKEIFKKGFEIAKQSISKIGAPDPPTSKEELDARKRRTYAFKVKTRELRAEKEYIDLLKNKSQQKKPRPERARYRPGLEINSKPFYVNYPTTPTDPMPPSYIIYPENYYKYNKKLKW